jgi:hypothetical protein
MSSTYYHQTTIGDLDLLKIQEISRRKCTHTLPGILGILLVKNILLPGALLHDLPRLHHPEPLHQCHSDRHTKEEHNQEPPKATDRLVRTNL